MDITGMGEVPLPVVKPKSTRSIFIIITLLVVLALGAGWWFLFGLETKQPQLFRLLENGNAYWYNLSPSQKEVTAGEKPETFSVPENLLSRGDFSAVVAGNGSVITLSPEGLVVITPKTKERIVLIKRTDLDYGSSAISYDGSTAVLYNPSTNELDIFALDAVRPSVVSYLGSVAIPNAIYAVGAFPDHSFIIRSGTDSFLLYTMQNGVPTLASSPSMNRIARKSSSLFSPTVAHAWTYMNEPTGTNANTTSGQRCTGTLVTSLGTASGSGIMPSPATTIWSYMPSPLSLPNDYNNGTYCIQAQTNVVSSGNAGGGGGSGGGGGGGGGGGNDGDVMGTVYESLFDPIFGLLRTVTPKAEAQTDSWSITYGLYSGTGTATGANYYTLLYPEGTNTTARLSASPSTIDRPNATSLTWSSTNATSCTGTGFSTEGAVSGTVAVSPTENTTYSVTCTGAQGSASQSATVTVLSRPDLKITGSSFPSSVTTGRTMSYDVTVTNAGVADVNTTSSTVFQRADSSTGLNARIMGSSDTQLLSAGVSGITTLDYAFSASGTYYVRACADNTTVVNESNESNNCGAWTKVTVTGESLQGVWVYVSSDITDFACPLTQPERAYKNMTDCPDLNPGGMSCSPLENRCKVNTPSGCNVYTDVYKCQVPSTTSGEVTATLDADPLIIKLGETARLSWGSTGAQSCVATDGSFTTGNAVRGSDDVSPTVTTEYTVACYAANMGGGSCGPQTAVYNPVCNADAEKKDITCRDGFKVKITDDRYCGHVGNFGGYQGFTEKATCVPCDGGASAGGTWTEVGYNANKCFESCPSNVDAVDPENRTCSTVGSQCTHCPDGTGSFNTSLYQCLAGNTGSTGAGVAYDSVTVEVVDALPPECSDERDNDGDGYVDATGTNRDPGCTDENDDDERNACADGRDNDGDGAIDANDGGCTDGGDNDESGSSLSCTVDTQQVTIGGSVVYTVTPTTSGGGSYTWSPEGGQSCSYSQGSAESCTPYRWYCDDEPFSNPSYTDFTASCEAGGGRVVDSGPGVVKGCFPGEARYYSSCCTAGAGGNTGQASCTFSEQGSYRMSVSGSGSAGRGGGATGGSAAQCPVVSAGCTVGEVSISASPDRIDPTSANNQSEITWEAPGTCTCSVSGPGLSSSENTGSQKVTIKEQSLYTIDCLGTKDTAIVNVTTNYDEF